MKITKIIIIVLLFIQCSKNHEVDIIIFKYLEWEIFTFLRVDCDKIESYGDKVFQFELTNSDTIKQIIRYINELVPFEEKGMPDVRIKIEINSKNNIVTNLCVGNNGITTLNGNNVSHNEDLVIYLRELIDKKYTNI